MDIDDFLDNEGSQSDAKPKSTKKQTPLELIEKIKVQMSKQKFEEAERTYMEAKEKYNQLVQTHLSEQNKIFAALEAINKAMVHALHGQKEETAKKIDVIQQLIPKVKNHLKNNALEQAEELYKQVEVLFKSLPELLSEKKLLLEKEIATLHMDIINKNNLLHSKKFHEMFQVIRNKLSIGFQSVKEGKKEDAVTLYQQINKSYEELPKGFLYEKALLYEQILKLFKAVQGLTHETKLNVPTSEPTSAPITIGEKPA